MVSYLIHVQLLAIPWTIAARLFYPWDSLDKNTEVNKPFSSLGDLPDNGEVSIIFNGVL